MSDLDKRIPVRWVKKSSYEKSLESSEGRTMYAGRGVYIIGGNHCNQPQGTILEMRGVMLGDSKKGGCGPGKGEVPHKNGSI